MVDGPLSATLGSTRAYEAARLRWGTESDASALSALWREALEADGRPDTDGETPAALREWMEHGGVVLLEDDQRVALCAIRWQWHQDGWMIDPIATRPAARGQGFGRWLMTKLEALAIKRNVPTLRLRLERKDLAPYYRRLGYVQDYTADDANLWVKRVGGTWQRQTEAAS